MAASTAGTVVAAPPTGTRISFEVLDDTAARSVVAVRVPEGDDAFDDPGPAARYVVAAPDHVGDLPVRIVQASWYAGDPALGTARREEWTAPDGDLEARPPLDVARHLRLVAIDDARGMPLALLEVHPLARPCPGEPPRPTTRLIGAHVVLTPPSAASGSLQGATIDEARRRALLSRVVLNPAQLPARVAPRADLPTMEGEGAWIELLRRAEARGRLLRLDLPDAGAASNPSVADGASCTLAAEALRDAGVDPAAWDPSTARVFRRGEEIAVAFTPLAEASGAIDADGDDDHAAEPAVDALPAGWLLRVAASPHHDDRSPLYLLTDAAPLRRDPPRRLAPSPAPAAIVPPPAPGRIAPRPAPTVAPPGGGADLLLVPAPGFEALAATIALERGALGWRPWVIASPTVADAFGWGTYDAPALRGLVAYALRYWGAPRPAALLLVGDAALPPGFAPLPDLLVAWLPGASPEETAVLLDRTRDAVDSVPPGPWMDRHLVLAGADRAEDDAAYALEHSLRRAGVATARITLAEEALFRHSDAPEPRGTWTAPQLASRLAGAIDEGMATWTLLGAADDDVVPISDIRDHLAAREADAAAAPATTLLIVAATASSGPPLAATEATPRPPALAAAADLWRAAPSLLRGALFLEAPAARAASTTAQLLRLAVAHPDLAIADLLTLAALPAPEVAPPPDAAPGAGPTPRPRLLFLGDPTLPWPGAAPLSPLAVSPSPFVVGRDDAIAFLRDVPEWFWGWADVALLDGATGRPLLLHQRRVRRGVIEGTIPLPPKDAVEGPLLLHLLAFQRGDGSGGGRGGAAWRAEHTIDRIVPRVRWDHPERVVRLAADGTLALELPLRADTPIPLDRVTIRLADEGPGGRVLFERALAFDPGQQRAVAVRARLGAGLTPLRLEIDPGLGPPSVVSHAIAAVVPQATAAAPQLALAHAAWRADAGVLHLDVLLANVGGAGPLAPLRLEAIADGAPVASWELAPLGADAGAALSPGEAIAATAALAAPPPPEGGATYRIVAAPHADGGPAPAWPVTAPDLPDLAIVPGSPRFHMEARDGRHTVFVIAEVELRGPRAFGGLAPRLELLDADGRAHPAPLAVAPLHHRESVVPGVRRTIVARWDPDGPIEGRRVRLVVDLLDDWPLARPEAARVDLPPIPD